MTEREDFLKRWSRRKREAKVEEPSLRDDTLPATPAKEEVERPKAHAQDAPARSETGEAATTEPFDLSKLPSLDSIGPDTDIRMFLQPGVPASLSRAALRRAWSADPAIRDFIGLSENSWDFTASDGMPGFGVLDPADAKRLLAQVFAPQEPRGRSETAKLVEQEAQTDRESEDGKALGADSSSPDAIDAASGDAIEAATDMQDRETKPEAGTQNVALQTNAVRPEPVSASTRRLHGRALPQ
ncbi:DUF3306 domain-containing protein [Pseudorhodoplanes sp.]|uniref:DUF3306 domain-containing protein n=1 Tax=Pseudorhodoplanes sp. TaxID=1934341 RepID=UPI00391A9683